MSFFNALIQRAASAGLSQAVYIAFLVLSILSILTFYLLFRRHYGIPAWKASFVAVVGWLIVYALVKVQYWLESGFTDWGVTNIVRGFVFIPLVELLLSRVLRLRFGALCDMVAVGAPLSQFAAHFGCCFAGCCHGFPASWGLWNPRSGLILFPVQLCESLAALAVSLYCLFYIRKTGYAGEGRAMPRMLIGFGVTRFFLEFLRDNNKVWGSVSDLALHAARMVLLGVIWLIVQSELDKKHTASAE